MIYKMKTCSKCLMPTEYDICNTCKYYEKEKRLLESDFTKYLKKNKNSKYDCLLMCSGGKDSVSAMYYIKEKYKLNPLVFTFDNGFETDEALENIKKATDKLGLDFLYYKNNEIKDIYKLLIENNFKAPICNVCSLWYMNLSYSIAKKYDLKLIIAGWTKGQMSQGRYEGDAFKEMFKATKEFIDFLKIKGYKLPYTSKEIQKKYSKINVLSPHWFIDYDEESLKEFLQKEFDWKAPKLSYPKGSTNCMMNFPSTYLSMKNYGFTHYHVEYSNLIRKGEITRKEAEGKLKIDFDKKFVNNILKDIDVKLK